jgi:hypothetical protein
VIRLIVAGALLLGLAIVSGVVLKSGLDEARLDTAGGRREVPVQELRDATGWITTFGCVRHDLAVGVTKYGRVYRLGTAQPDSEDSDRVFTPLASAQDCNEESKPKTVYALVEDDDSLGTTISYTYKQKVAPPPVPAVVSGVIGYGVGHKKLADEARGAFARDVGVVLDEQPLFVKGKQPGVLWVAVLTAAAGGHGFLFVALAAFWIYRRARRKKKILDGEVVEAEEEFFKSETLD